MSLLHISFGAVHNSTQITLLPLNPQRTMLLQAFASYLHNHSFVLYQSLSVCLICVIALVTRASIIWLNGRCTSHEKCPGTNTSVDQYPGEIGVWRSRLVQWGNEPACEHDFIYSSRNIIRLRDEDRRQWTLSGSCLLENCGGNLSKKLTCITITIRLASWGRSLFCPADIMAISEPSLGWRSRDVSSKPDVKFLRVH